MKEFGFIRIGAVVNKLFLSAPSKNAKEIVRMIKVASEREIGIVLFPELCITGYTCGDLFFNEFLLSSAEESLNYIIENTKDINIISIVGLPVRCDNTLLNCAIVIEKGKIKGVVPKTYIPNYSEFYEKRWFSSSLDIKSKEIILCDQTVPLDTKLIFKDKENKNISFCIEICEDLWVVNPPSNNHSLMGATITFNLSSSNETIGKNEYRKDLIKMQSAKNISAYIYSSSGVMESSSDILFSGASMIYENGVSLAEGKRFELESSLIYSDIDTNYLINERQKNISYLSNTLDKDYKYIEVSVRDFKFLERKYKKYPFIPTEDDKNKRYEEIINIAANALSRRLIHLNYPKCVIGMSGGLDSTLAFLIVIKSFEIIKKDLKNIIGITMPGFGTTDRTYYNAISIVKEYGATIKEISIKESSKLHMKDIGLPNSDRSIVYENIQARERTQILMDYSNMCDGIVIGTGSLSELALGWCTYNGDHMSMYAINASIPKTLVRDLVNYFEKTIKNKKIKRIIGDILATPISPELLPPDEYGKITQKTEAKVGPYVLYDFFLYHFLKTSASPKKIKMLAINTFRNEFNEKEIDKWLNTFIKRFFKNQFKRNCMPDSVKIGSISLSPRGDLRLPSDLDSDDFLGDLQ